MATSTDRREIEALCADLNAATVAKFLAGLDSEYLRRFDAPAIAQHLRTILTLPDRAPLGLMARAADGVVECDVMVLDRPFAFSLITGALASTGFSVESSDVFTLEPLVDGGRRKQGTIIDHFRGRLLGPLETFEAWNRVFEPLMRQIAGLLAGGEEEAAEQAKRLVNERVTRWLTDRRASGQAVDVGKVLEPVDIRVEQLGGRTRLHLQAPDVPAFLYALSTAMAFQRLSIRQMRVRTIKGRATDEIDVVDSDGRALADRRRLDEVKLCVLLTRQFAYFLDRAPDPFSALTRFERLAGEVIGAPQRGEWLQLLANPHTMMDLARVLGTSEYLWEDFIRLHADALLPILRPYVQGRSFCPAPSTVPRRLEECLEGSADLAERRDRLNQFKDRELFLIDLDHILSTDHPDVRFRVLSERLVLLAENLVAKAVALVHADLVEEFGRPLDEKGGSVEHAVFGLGKLGGVALGYASDIELLFVYSSAGQTEGGTSEATSTTDFFDRLALETSRSIRTKRDGIFRVDLRLRPFGSDGPRACSRQQFREYYAPGGHAHPFESLAMVRMRWIAGDPKLGFEIEELRDRFLYEGPPPNLEDIWEVSGKMRQRHNPTRQLNAKYSPGALIDLEGAVQLLQVIHGRDVPQLRTPRLQEAVESLQRAGVVTALEFEQITEAYQFLRRLINSRRILRGSAQDLLIPPAGSDELMHLARRMEYGQGGDADGAATLLADFGRHTAVVRQFVRRHFGRDCPGAS